MPTLNLNNVDFHYDEAGIGGAIVLLHGFPLDNHVWREQLAHLADRHRVITIDLRGFGKTISTEPFSIASLASDVHGVLEQLGVLPCVLGGLSMGGYVALAFARLFPKDLRALMLIDTKSDADTPEARQARNDMIQIAREKGSAAIAEKMMPKMLSDDTRSNRPAVVRELQAIMNHCPALTIEHALSAMRDRDDMTPLLPTLKMPGAADCNVSRLTPLSPPTRPGRTEFAASTRVSCAPSYTLATCPKTAKASARIGKNDRNAKYVTAAARALPLTEP